MSIEEQIRTIVTDELETQLIELEKRLRNSMRQENRELKEQMDALGVQLEQVQARFGEFSLRIEKLEEDLSNRFGLVVKLRKYTLDQLMSEYKRLTGTMRPEQEETVENAEI